MVEGAGSRLLLIRPPRHRASSQGRARGRSHSSSDRSLEEQEPGHWAAGDEHLEGSTTLTLLHPHPTGQRSLEGEAGGEEGEGEAIPSIFSLRHPLGTFLVVVVVVIIIVPCRSCSCCYCCCLPLLSLSPSADFVVFSMQTSSSPWPCCWRPPLPLPPRPPRPMTMPPQ